MCDDRSALSLREDQPRPGSLAFQAMFALAVALRIASKRNGFECGQTLSPARGEKTSHCARFGEMGIKRRCAVLALPALISIKPLRRSRSVHVRRSISSERTPANAWSAIHAAAFGVAAWRIFRSSTAVKTSMSAGDSFRLPTPSSKSASRESHPRL